MKTARIATGQVGLSEVVWPSGNKEELRKLAVNRLLTQPEGQAPVVSEYLTQ